jgi:predicted AAA+ superfamily ATPase
MPHRKRIFEQLLRDRLATHRIVGISGPKQIGKTTACHALSRHRLDWDRVADRLDRLRGRQTTLVIENLHGHRKWPAFLRKLSARCGAELRLVVSMPDIVRGTGRASGLCNFRLHPWTVGECARSSLSASLINPPAAISDEDWNALLEHGGFPEPFAKRDPSLTRRWDARRWEELIGDDLPKVVAVRDPAITQMLALRLISRSATPLIYSDLSRELNVSVDTVCRWLRLLETLQVGFRVRPWYARVPKALRKEPRWFLRDWSGVTDPEARAQTFIACHLLKAVQSWHDAGLGRFELCYVRDKTQREVDFLIVRDGKPWFLVDVPNPDAKGSLKHFQRHTRAQHAFRIVMDAPYSPVDCFAQGVPIRVAARTLLSQLP